MMSGRGALLRVGSSPNLGSPRGCNQAQRQQHAAACHSMPQRQILGAVGGNFEACCGMPQQPEFFTWRTFFNTMLNLWTLCCTGMSERDGGLVIKVLDSSLKGPWFNSQSCQIFACQLFSAVPQIFVLFRVSVPCQLLRLLPLLRHRSGLKIQRNLQGTRIQHIVYSGPLGKVVGTTFA